MSKLPFPYQKLTDDPEMEDDIRWWVHCPFHEGDNTASMCINKNNPYKLHYKCFACQAYGSPQQFAQKMKLNPNFINEDIKQEKIEKPKIDWKSRLKTKIRGTTIEGYFANNMGVSEKTLQKFNLAVNEVGLTHRLLIPMYQGKDIVGIQEQWVDKKNKRVKKSQKHSSMGWFVPQLNWDTRKPLYILEGFSDTATIIDMGLQAIGRYNAKAKIKPLDGTELFSSKIIISDNNDVGKEGSEALKKKLQGASVLLLPPEYEDIRQMYRWLGRKETKKYLEA